ncbi:uncharacterized protein LOC117288500 [Asterias rubens]|uniref:uncharacterized protein LOC117288500 n=1 Tax=Asterias rubens TaxID=7604 RepID=UPI0014552C64|nr:uncharacterized protein LOC117288500 [Asterias rubens]XP_033625273.1 uncharacterized protein LOC117288500 [Asterias rubens]
MAALLVLLAALCLISGVQSQPDSDVCTLHGPTVGPPLPVLPEKYMLKVEANIQGWNHTIEVIEFYDGVSNRGAVNNIWKGAVSQTVVSYTTEEIFHVGSDGSCRVEKVTASSFNIYGFQIVNGTAHIGNINDIFRFGAQYNETYMGQTTIRGIPANHWQSCLYQEEQGSTSLLDYYFTVANYSGAYGDREVPLRLELNGRAPNREFIHGKVVPSNGTHNYSHVYEFFDVQYHPEFPDRSFEPHLGVVCPGRKSPKPFPVIPDHFSVNYEMVSTERHNVFYARQAYNYKSKMSATYYTLLISGTPTKFHSLDDFNTGLTYQINLNNGSCNITPIGLAGGDASLAPDNVHVQIKDVANLLYLGIDDWQYQGLTKLREIDTESWIAKKLNYSSGNRPISNITVEFFFSTATWNTEGGLQNTSNMPVMAKYQWSEKKNGTEEMVNHNYIINFFHFEANNISTSHFDLSPCFSDDNSEELAFDIANKGAYSQYILNNTIEFYHGAQYSIAKAAAVTPTRVASLFAAKGSDGVTTVFFQLLGIPWVKGNAVNTTSQTPLDEAYMNLEDAVNSGQLRLDFKHKGEDVYVSPQSNSLRTEFTFDEPDDEASSFSVGTFIGFGFGMFILGGLLCAGIVFVIRKKMVEPSVPYNVQS